MARIVGYATGFRGIAAAVIGGALMVMAVTWGLVAERVRYEERDAVADAAARSQSLAIAFEQQVSRTLQTIDQAALFLRHEYEEEGAGLDLRRVFTRNLDSRDFLYAAIVDERGRFLFATASEPGNDVSDRDYFVHHRAVAADRLRIGTPTVARFSGMPSVQFTRRISGPKGEFRGVVVLGMAPGILADQSRHIDVGAKGQVLLLGLDGISRARRIGTQVTAGDDARASTLLARASEARSGSYLSLGRFDATPRYMSFRALPDHDLVAAVGLSEADVLAPARERARHYYAAAAASSALAVLVAALLLAALWRRNRANAELRRFRATLDLSNDAIYIVSRRTMTIVDANEVACRALDRRREELVGVEPHLVFTHSSVLTRADLERIYDRLIAGPRRAENVERTHRRKDGTVFPVEIQRSAVEVDGEWYIVALARDISARRATEQALRESEARYRSLAESSPDAILVHSKYKLVFVNQAMCELLGAREPGELVGRPATFMLEPAWQGPARERIAALYAGAAQPRAEQVYRTLDGRVLDVEIAAAPVSLDGRPAAHVTVRDISERKREDRLARMEHDIARGLADAATLSAGVQSALGTLCQAQRWEAARFYALDEDADMLRYSEGWTIPDARYEGFNQASRSLSFRRGVGLGGLVWQSGEPLWVPDVTRDARVINPQLANTGIRSAFIFPVVAESKTTGIVASFSCEVREPDERLLRGMRAIGAQIGQFVERKRAQERADHLAQFDAVTELPNRTLYYDRLAQTLTQAQRHAWHVGVLFCDVDFFKKVNDTLGHAAGDRLLQDIAKRLAVAVRPGDTVARIGGDEFAVLAADLARPQDAALVAEKLVECLRLPFSIDGHEIFATGSVGIATYPQDGRDGVALMKNADAAMSRAKEMGRNNYQFYAAAMNERALENLQLQNDLRKALERDEFRLHFQPKAHLRSGCITGFEALLRWERPGKGLVSPALFIPLLEETGLIIPVGAWVIRAACAQIAAWRRAGLRPLPVAVNLAAKQLAQPDLVALVEAALREHGVEPELLELEVTESDAMQNPEQCMAMLEELRARGVAVSIDDFGTGYSSLSYLKRMPVVALKLDRSFVKGLPADAEDASITKAVITLAHSLGLKVVAEGVETAPQRDFLAGLGCDQMQGYLLSKPLPAGQCDGMLIAAVPVPAAA